MLFIIKNTDLRVRGFECFDRLHVEGGMGGGGGGVPDTAIP